MSLRDVSTLDRNPTALAALSDRELLALVDAALKPHLCDRLPQSRTIMLELTYEIAEAIRARPAQAIVASRITSTI